MGELEGWRSARTFPSVSWVIRTFIFTSLVKAEGGKKTENSLLKGRSDLVKADTEGDEVLCLLACIFRVQCLLGLCLRDRAQGREE